MPASSQSDPFSVFQSRIPAETVNSWVRLLFTPKWLNSDAMWNLKREILNVNVPSLYLDTCI